MTKVVSFGEEKQKRAPHCEYCGAEEHGEGTFMCPRIAGVTYDQEENSVTVVFIPDWKPPVAG